MVSIDVNANKEEEKKKEDETYLSYFEPFDRLDNGYVMYVI
jgi:hypothetical protein